jgi:molybdopterin-guanine dinucleotide biosynthesis protein A
MGSAKAGLEWHGSTLLRRVSGVLARVVDGPVIVVRAPGQPLPEPVPGAVVVADPHPGLGPLIGLATGLRAAAEAGAELAFVAATDLPFLHPALVRRVLRELSGAGPDTRVVWPLVDGFPQPLVAAYRTALASALDELAGGGERRLRALADHVRVRELDAAALLADPALAAVDPELTSVRNVNSPTDYAAARARPAPSVTVRVGGRARRVHAATLGAAAEAGGLCDPAPNDPAPNDPALGGPGRAPGRVEPPAVVREADGAGEIVSRDGQLPLAAGDTVELRPSGRTAR